MMLSTKCWLRTISQFDLWIAEPKIIDALQKSQRPNFAEIRSDIWNICPTIVSPDREDTSIDI